MRSVCSKFNHPLKYIVISPLKKVTLFYIFFLAVICSIAVVILARNETTAVLNNELQQLEITNAKIAVLISGIYDENLSSNKIQQILQNALKEDPSKHTFLSVFNWSGKVIAHPDPIKLGNVADYYDATVLKENDIVSVEGIYDQLKDSDVDIVVSINSIDKTDWIIASHVDTDSFKDLEKKLLFDYGIVFLIIFLLLSLLLIVVLRYLKNNLEQQIEEKQSLLADSMTSIELLNKNLEFQQANILEEIDKVKNEVKVSNRKISTVPENTATDKIDKNLEQVETHTDGYKTRILTYVRNELVSLAVEDIAVIYVDHTITYFLRFDGKRSTSSDSLDQIFSSLNPKLFFKANRQFIVSITAIEKISKYGNSQLKLKTKPEIESEIIIGKNKAASFKKWLNI